MMLNGAATAHDGDVLLRRLELRHLRYFVAVAEELSFRRAAQRLHLSQPPLTIQIQQLEQLLEARLLERNKQRVMLTVAGRELLGQARQLLGKVAGLKACIVNAAHGTGGELRIGYTESAIHVGVLLKSIQSIRLQRPGVVLTLCPMASTLQLAALERAELDVGFVWTLPDRVAGALDCALVRQEPLVAALPRGHGLGKTTKPLSLSVLEREQFVMIARDNGTLMFRTVIRLCRDAGFTPQIAYEAPDLASVLGLVASGAGIGIVPSVMTCMKAPGVVYRPIGDPACRIGLHWVSRRGDTSPLVRGLREALLDRPTAPPAAAATAGSAPDAAPSPTKRQRLPRAQAVC